FARGLATGVRVIAAAQPLLEHLNHGDAVSVQAQRLLDRDAARARLGYDLLAADRELEHPLSAALPSGGAARCERTQPRLEPRVVGPVDQRMDAVVPVTSDLFRAQL